MGLSNPSEASFNMITLRERKFLKWFNLLI